MGRNTIASHAEAAQEDLLTHILGVMPGAGVGIGQPEHLLGTDDIEVLCSDVSELEDYFH